MTRTFRVVNAVLVFTIIFSDDLRAVSGRSDCDQSSVRKVRPHSVSITEFGAVGDGITLNTKAFQNAIFYLKSFSDKGGAELFLPAGKFLTGSFELISHLTLWLDQDAVILGSTDSSDWPVVDSLPSYGRGRELPGKRHRSLIYGHNLTDIVIAGNNGTIDGQGGIWWTWFLTQTLNYTRPHLVELVNSTSIKISNLTFLNSPFWAIHPVYCSHIHVQNVTILAPLDSPNTDGIDPDSSDNVCIEDCYIRTGDDLIAIKSGWDEYGMSYGRPSSNITIRGLVGQTTSSGVAIGSEMSGGVSEVHVENVYIYNSSTGIRIKTSPGRGGYVRDVYVSNVLLTNVHVAIKLTGYYGEHPDEEYDQNALPDVQRITISDLVGVNIHYAGILNGIEGDPFHHICFQNISISAIARVPWNCTNIQGYSDSVYPETCEQLGDAISSDYCFSCYCEGSMLQTSSSESRGNSESSWSFYDEI